MVRRSSLMFRGVPCLLVSLISAGISMYPAGAAAQADFVFHISVDGLRPDAVTTLGATELPNLYRLRTEGAFTDNARTDYDNTNTLPNHAGGFTGRPVLDRLGTNSGHRWEFNGNPNGNVWSPRAFWGNPPVDTLHANAGYYIHSVFDVANDGGLKTGLYTTKERFLAFKQTWENQIDTYVQNHKASTTMMNTLLTNMGAAATRTNYTFILFHDPDSAGHDHTWNITPGSQYLNAVKTVDNYLGQIFNLIKNDPDLDGRTTIVLTSDHGGPLGGTSHTNAALADNYTVPFYVWGVGVTPGDLYEMNDGIRLDPGTGRPEYTSAIQPIRVGDGANLSLQLLGLGAVPNSGINADQSLIVPEPSSALLLLGGAGMVLIRRRGHTRP